jgi:protein-tyrosine phosphatase
MPSWVTDSVAVGGAGIMPETWPDLVAKYRFTAVLSLRGEFQDAFGPPFPQAYLWLPVPDHTEPPPEQLLIGAQFIDAAVQSKQRVLVHCKMGIGRSPTMVAAYLVWRGSPIDDAIETVTRAADMIITRPVVSRLTLEKFTAYLTRKG